ncbi:MAG TPA: alpha/beta hydrolase [Bryobacteraceae bacterium]|nr:alpha/beta hydrolase [Bryobacteraceae bacterium]
MRRILRNLWIASGLLFTAWIVWGFQSTGIPPDTFTSTDTLQVAGNSFRPTAGTRNTGILFLPGGMVDPLSYAPVLRQFAASGYPALLIPLPYRCACTDSQIESLFAAVRAAMEAQPQTRWYLAGHSRGAMLASRFARNPPANLEGLILLATTHPRDFDLSASRLRIAKILGSSDGVATPAAARANAHLLPSATRWFEIPGANHVQFGYYRHQLGDHTATISRAEQQAHLQNAIRQFLDR